jgi:hypothetical protein
MASNGTLNTLFIGAPEPLEMLPKKYLISKRINHIDFT